MKRSLTISVLKYNLVLVRYLEHAPTKFFTYVCQNATRQSKLFRVLKQNGSLSDGMLELVSIFKSYIRSVCCPYEHRSSPPIAIFDLLVPKLEIATSMITALFKLLSNQKSPGIDDIFSQL